MGVFRTNALFATNIYAFCFKFGLYSAPCYGIAQRRFYVMQFFLWCEVGCNLWLISRYGVEVVQFGELPTLDAFSQRLSPWACVP